ncbi:hypothetical protein [Aquisalimonas asiatica]|uniref:Uncharacterized protein n=1 Tax=Aquisalimonas asiatica TaxID=406100 RepID=A0A1H8V728_9GAMM|nr:hypothetical protein [Aquisalimonas asiatica]SEP11151.1 hypothetical protein SAMN04488052_11048 [Aquisalimonas asiatica]
MADHHSNRNDARLRAHDAPGIPAREQALLAAFGARAGIHRLLPRLSPILLALTIGVWLLAPPAAIHAVTPWVGAAALIGAGAYLARIVLVTGRVTLDQATRNGTLTPATVTRIRRGILQAMAMAGGTIALGIAFLVTSLHVLQDGAPAAYAALLWGLCLGGFLLSLYIGELVMRLADTVEAPQPRPDGQ